MINIKYTSEARQQALKEELSAEVASCILASCEAFHTLNQTYPARILVYRDGVSEGQFSTVLNQEVAAIIDALAKKRVDAKLTYIIVNKRIDAKVLSARSDEGCSEGTVVDSLITRRDLYDFYIVPLFSRNGLANPVHYAVLHDGSQEDPARSIRPHALYALTYKLCFMYYNWSGPVRAPAPCMFAHKLAYLLGDLQDKDTTYLPKPKLMSTVSCWYL
jgi:aubergine-like protein